MFQIIAIPIETLHDIVFYVLYAMCVVVTFIAIERAIYFWFASRHATNLERALKPGVRPSTASPICF